MLTLKVWAGVPHLTGFNAEGGLRGSVLLIAILLFFTLACANMSMYHSI